ncbi:Shugoshin, C-terminal [Ostreococcus tauri]|uniref:Shugoshin, C-terminal n=1 Tax=Ostreococcus tauri TaxID=70448 RepID=A0A090LYX7_OSTTA|nr:Shugoshin, C-terminal [Ostreococcus tauri]CEF97210.1 Shugoshin, C-terminal [Ostreococcus tauri]|eukprot:XP_003078277.2 Shugoshin, C-terminal [Ostreococcus tauri]
MRTALGIVRKTVEEEKLRWMRELGRARDEATELRIELARARAMRDESTSEEDSRGTVVDDEREESEDSDLEQAAETLRELAVTLSEAASELRVVETKTPKRDASRPIQSMKMNVSPLAGETARRALRLRHAMKAVNYAEPSLKVKMRRPVDDGEVSFEGITVKRKPPRQTPPASPERSEVSVNSLDAMRLSPSPSSKSPSEIISLVPSLQPTSMSLCSKTAPSPPFESRPRRRSAVGISYAEPDLVHKMRRP